MIDPYKILNLSKDATKSEIKKAYRSIMKKNHPDRNPGNKAAEQRCKEAGEAYDILGNPEKRKKYDNFIKQQQQRQRQSSPRFAQQAANMFIQPNIPFSSLIESFLSPQSNQIWANIANSQPYSISKAVTILPIHISFEEMWAGTTAQIKTPGGTREVIIPAGVKTGDTIDVPSSNGHLIKINIIVMPCKNIQRKGNDIYMDIQTRGEGKIHLRIPKREIEVDIPKNCKRGKKIRLKNLGVLGGDLFLIVNK